MDRAIEQNYKLVQSARKEVEENRCDLLETVQTQVNRYHATLSELEREIKADINSKAFLRQREISLREKKLHEAVDQLKALKTEYSDTVENIVQANANKRLDKDFSRLHQTLDKWNLKYGLLQIGRDVLNLEHFLNMNIDMVTELPEQAVNGVPVSLFEPLVPLVKVKEIVTWMQRDKDVRGLVYHSHGGGNVTIVSSSRLRAYKQNGKMWHSTEHADDIYRVTTFGEGWHAVLDVQHNEVRCYYKWPIFLGKDACTKIPETLEIGCCISGTQNYLVYSAGKDSTSFPIKCYSVAYNPPKLLRQWALRASPRSLSVLETPNHLLVVIAYSLGTLRKNARAVFALYDTKILWKINFESLDREARNFDLSDMCNDGRHIFVLNTHECCVYLVSVGGKVMSKILRNLQIPRAIACDSKTKNLVVACYDKRVTVYKLDYKE